MRQGKIGGLRVRVCFWAPYLIRWMNALRNSGQVFVIYSSSDYCLEIEKSDSGEEFYVWREDSES